uniref:Matrix AAA peptidase interacting protein 1 n=2 Tax=Phasianidae TaxID=9005 RepID=A0A8C9LA55_PAVCR
FRRAVRLLLRRLRWNPLRSPGPPLPPCPCPLRFRRSGARTDVPGPVRTAAMMALRAAPRRTGWLARALLAPGAARTAPLIARVPAPLLPGFLPALPASRFASSGPQGPEGEGPQRRVVVVRITNPLAWLRTRFYYLLIRLYFDPEFSIEEFTRGAKQVGSAKAECKYHCGSKLYWYFLAVQMLKEKISSLSENHRDALAADMDAIMYTTEGDVRIYYDDDGRKFVSILMRFWYLNGANLPDEVPGETKVFQIVFGDESTKEKRHILTANYEFQREFTEGAKPDWTITRIEHPKLLE